MKIIYSPLCLITTLNPVRVYQRRRWQTDAQATRKHKKWVKRYGFKQEPTIFQMAGEQLIAHPSFKPAIDAALVAAGVQEITPKLEHLAFIFREQAEATDRAAMAMRSFSMSWHLLRNENFAGINTAT